ncbi:MAG TPA: hypothetical protein VF475_04695 [Sphingobium sp.]
MTHRLYAMTALLVLGGCAAHPARVCDREGPARIGQTAYVGGPMVRPDRLIEDSRCPIDVQCVRAGEVKIAATVTGGDWKKEVELTLGKPIQIADGRLTLLSAAPQKRSGQEIAPESYRFTFDFKGGL